MHWPKLHGVLRRRILVNYRLAPEAAARLLPAPFRPRLHAGFAIGGICLLRLEQMRPVFLPGLCGIASENALHRIAVSWEDQRGLQEGVYILRRDTNSPLVMLTRGKLLPGDPHLATFAIEEDATHIDADVRSEDGEMSLHLCASVDPAWPGDSCFGSLGEASRFCETGTVGYSLRRGAGGLEGFQWKARRWQAQPLRVLSLYSQFFDHSAHFPAGTAQFDHALLLQNVQHDWQRAPALVQECAAL